MRSEGGGGERGEGGGGGGREGRGWVPRVIVPVGTCGICGGEEGVG